jgi:hypothetical protein
MNNHKYLHINKNNYSDKHLVLTKTLQKFFFF